MDNDTQSGMNSKNQLQQIRTALAMMAAFRGAKPDGTTLTAYSGRLQKAIVDKVRLEDVIAAIEKLADMPREEGELAFPEVGVLLDMSVVMSVQRFHRIQASRADFLVRWACKSCGIHKSGWIATNDTAPRICKGIHRSGNGPCGATMEIVYDERGRPTNEYYQQQVCPGCGNIIAMMRPVGEQFRTWCGECKAYRKIYPEDMTLTEAEWQLLCVELETIHREWLKRGSKVEECVCPQFDRERVRGAFA